MFGLSKKKRFDFQCPMCSRLYEFKLDPSVVTVFDYELLGDHAFLAREKCGFCKVEMTVLLTTEGEIRAIDEKWQKLENEYWEKSDTIDNEISELEEEIYYTEDVSDSDKEKLKKQITLIQLKQKKLNEAFEKKEEKYEERKMNWYEKWLAKE